MVTAILSLLSALLALVPVIMNLREGRKARANAMAKRSLDELHAGTDDVLRAGPTLQP